MISKQLAIATHFESIIEDELSLCMENYRKATDAVNLDYYGLTDEEITNLDATNHEIDIIAKYWFLRATSLIEIIEKKNYLLAKELRDKYLK
ncbi:hypothetical protein F7734_10480 [Scytonema sp. UIC 10036]|uniref:hypothetical protein n=1 Tax=Scytonema sp. UIC 10036 TaxID=2304196 RepID=UPI0012DAD2C4|nr:hypothetical protein [Scytonema sp. UIC 10036]MUG92852.1 hypothetical protein [Scytonema sp. UIC 10036]